MACSSPCPASTPANAALGAFKPTSASGAASFEQVALWVDGIRWSAPHTAHHLLNLPIDPEDIQRVQVVRGGSGALGSGGVTGGIVLHTGPGEADETELSVEGGSYGWNRIRARHDWGQDQTRHRISLSRAATDGYRDNTDLAMTRLRYAGRKVTDQGTFNLQAGAMSAAFGAQDFYTASFPQQFEQVGSVAGQLTWQHEVGGWNVEAGPPPPEPQRPLRTVPRRGRVLRGETPMAF